LIDLLKKGDDVIIALGYKEDTPRGIRIAIPGGGLGWHLRGGGTDRSIPRYRGKGGSTPLIDRSTRRGG